ncbi:PP2C family protein-serine/threonine phosphatase [Nocardia lasii]|uniref:PP2C family protein-serine/threonine phosphatase n=1 Tax=Nocardia lasii TaxID=1616107 RepID=A0ABW1JTR8_9NOCA
MSPTIPRSRVLKAVAWIALVLLTVSVAGSVSWIAEHTRAIVIVVLCLAPLFLRPRAPWRARSKPTTEPSSAQVEQSVDTQNGLNMMWQQQRQPAGMPPHMDRRPPANSPGVDHGDRRPSANSPDAVHVDRRHPASTPDAVQVDRRLPAISPRPEHVDRRSSAQPQLPIGESERPTEIPRDQPRIGAAISSPSAPSRETPTHGYFFDFGAQSLRGLRQRNEDAWLAERNVLGCADGAGGRPHGREASKEALTAAAQALAEPGNTLIQAIREATARVESDAANDPRRRATTLDLVVLDPNGDLTGAHIGDGRVWLFPANCDVPEQMTADHRGEGSHLARSIGGDSDNKDPDLWIRAVGTGDRVVLATDGLWSRLPDTQVERLLIDTIALAPQDAVNALAQAALSAGGTDNVTVIVADIAAPIPPN